MFIVLRAARPLKLWALSLVLAATQLTLPAKSRAEVAQSVQIAGAKRTREHVLVELLPRPTPTTYSSAELEETERRIANLGVFDHVEVRQRGAVVNIEVREKWTLIPSFDLATGKTLKDLYVALGATEYNMLGTASSLGISIYRQQRGFGFSASFREHEMRRHRWAFGGETGYGASSLRFPDDSEWVNTRGDVNVWATSLPLGSPYLNLKALLSYAHEQIDDVVGDVHPPNGNAVQAGLEVTWDMYRFHDLVPRGLRLAIGGGDGVFAPVMQQRAQVEASFIGALPLARYTVLTGRIEGRWTNRGNANHSSLLGSIQGVRGLEDSRYRNWRQAYANVELRQAVPVISRLALQFVVFADGAVFDELTSSGRGTPGGVEHAFSGGLGARVIPTLLTQVLLRFDVARMVVPDRTWFWQIGLTQYF